MFNFAYLSRRQAFAAPAAAGDGVVLLKSTKSIFFSVRRIISCIGVTLLNDCLLC